MPVNVASLIATLSLNDAGFQRGMGGARSEMQSMSSRLTSLGGQVTGLGTQLTVLTAPITAGFVAGINQAANYEEIMVEIRARTGLTADEMQRVSDFALQMGADTVFSAGETAQAFLDLLTSGQSVDEAFSTLPSVLSAAAAGGVDLARAADAVTDIMAAFQLGVGDSQFVVDSLARAAGSSSADMLMLTDAFANVGPVARQFGLGVDETAALLAVMAENGIKGAEAGTQLRSMLLNMSRDTESTNEAWAALGLSLFDAQGNMQDMPVLLTMISQRLNDGTLSAEEQNQIMQDLFGSYGIVAAGALTTEGAIIAMNESMAGQADAASVANERMGTFNTIMDSLGGSIEAWNIRVFQPFIEDTLKPMALAAIENINQFTLWAEQNPENARTLLLIAGAAIIAGPLLIGLGLIISAVGTVVGLVTTGFGLLAGAVGLLLSPAGALVAIIAALVYALHQLYPGGLPQLLIDASTAAQQLAFIGLYHLNNAAQWARQRVQELLNTINAAIQRFQELVGRIGAGIGGIGGIGNLLGSGQISVGDIFNAARAEFGFQPGGWTGSAPSNQVTGVVHGQEWVVPTQGGLVLRESGGGGGGMTIENLIIYANSRAEGAVAADGFAARMQEIKRRRG